jgi:hypothetical protein
VTDFLDEKHKQITDRLKELKPLVDEFNRLEAAASALAGAIGLAASQATSAATAAVTRRRRPGRPRGSSTRKPTTATATTAPKATRKKPGRPPGRKKAGRPAPVAKAAATAPRRPGRRKGSGTRAAQALSLVQAQPGITIPELATRMGIKQNYLYRVLPGLEQENKVQKKGRGWYAKGG